MNSKYVMCNVVCYDGCEAWVSKFILRNCDTKQQIKDIDVMGYDAQILKIDVLYELEPDNIIAILTNEEQENKIIAGRYKDMYM